MKLVGDGINKDAGGVWGGRRRYPHRHSHRYILLLITTTTSRIHVQPHFLLTPQPTTQHLKYEGVKEGLREKLTLHLHLQYMGHRMSTYKQCCGSVNFGCDTYLRIRNHGSVNRNNGSGSAKKFWRPFKKFSVTRVRTFFIWFDACLKFNIHNLPNLKKKLVSLTDMLKFRQVFRKI